MQMCPTPCPSPRGTVGSGAPAQGGQPGALVSPRVGWEEAAAGATHSHLQWTRSGPESTRLPSSHKNQRAQPWSQESLEGCPAGSPWFAETLIHGLAAPSAGPRRAPLASTCSKTCFTGVLDSCASST